MKTKIYISWTWSNLSHVPEQNASSSCILKDRYRGTLSSRLSCIFMKHIEWYMTEYYSWESYLYNTDWGIQESHIWLIQTEYYSWESAWVVSLQYTLQDTRESYLIAKSQPELYLFDTWELVGVRHLLQINYTERRRFDR